MMSVREWGPADGSSGLQAKMKEWDLARGEYTEAWEAAAALPPVPPASLPPPSSKPLTLPQLTNQLLNQGSTPSGTPEELVKEIESNVAELKGLIKAKKETMAKVQKEKEKYERKIEDLNVLLEAFDKGGQEPTDSSIPALRTDLDQVQEVLSVFSNLIFQKLIPGDNGEGTNLLSRLESASNNPGDFPDSWVRVDENIKAISFLEEANLIERHPTECKVRLAPLL